MDVIQNSVLIRERRKWKKRWGVLKKVSPDNKVKNHEDAVYYLFLYKDASHAKEGKEKQMFPLFHFCGLDFLDELDRVKNVFVIITLSHTIYLSFEILNLQDVWYQVFEDAFGKCEMFDVSIPDKKVAKPGEANIRIYPTFFSIVQYKSHKSLNRWLLKDILNYQALSQSVLSFEMVSRKGNGSVINLKIPDKAGEAAMLIEKFISHQPYAANSSNLHFQDFHGSGLLDDLNQAKRKAGDQNVFTRALLRASNRIKKKNRRNVNDKKKSRSEVGEEKFLSLERKKCPQLSVHLDDQTLINTIQKVKMGGSIPSRLKDNDQQPALPQKKYNSKSSIKSLGGNSTEIDGVSFETKGRSFTANDINYTPREISPDFMKDTSVDSLKTTKLSIEKPFSKNINDFVVPSPTDKNDINVKRLQKRSMDSATVSNFKTPAKLAIEKTKKSSRPKLSNKTPTAPPRSPISLGLEQSKFQFPPEKIDEQIEEKNCESNHEDRVSCNSRTSYNGSCDDAFIINDTTVLNNNIPSPSEKFSLGMYNRGPTPYGRNINQNKSSDPLSLENWSLATGDGKVPQTSSSQPNVKQTDYINVSGHVHSDDDNDSYVNIKQKNKPLPLRLGSYRNEFEKYDDDEDSSIYHQVGAMENSQGSDSMLFAKQPNRSYENLNAPPSVSKKSDYLNLMSPLHKNKQSLNYVTVGKIDAYTSRSTSASPVRKVQRSPLDSYNDKDYTTIDATATGALNKSMQEHRLDRDKPRMVKTPSTK